MMLVLPAVAHAQATVTVNLSPQGLRDLQEEETLRRFIGTLRDAQERLASQHGQRKPMLLKIAPDLTDTELDAIAEVLLASGIDGVVDRTGTEGAVERSD